MSNIENFKSDIDRPMEIALEDAIRNAIDELVVNKMTIVEIIGILEKIKLDLWHIHCVEDN